MKSTLTYHAMNDRMERIEYILDNIPNGFGEPFIEQKDQKGDDDVAIILTTSGIVIVKSVKDNKIITTFIASIDRATAIYRSTTGNQNMPNWLYNTILKNAKALKRWTKSHPYDKEAA